MLKDVQWSESGTYQTDSCREPVEFFTQALLNSSSFDLQLGYFNSAAISVLSYGFAHFIARGGNMRMSINQVVSHNDKEAIKQGLSDEILQAYDLTDIKKLKSTLDSYGRHFFECLAYMIQNKRIQIKIVRPVGKSGIEHKKLGIFDDGEMKVAFTGSANFTIGGLINNHEDIQISLSTSPDEKIQKRIVEIEDQFESLMQGWAGKVIYLNASDLEEAIASEFGGTDIDELVNVEDQLEAAKKNEYRKVADTSKIQFQVPRFPYDSGPRDYQVTAFENWRGNDQKALFAMATGTGKTITSLNCLLEIYKHWHYYKALILVPTVTLVNQWEAECHKFKFFNIIKVFSKNQNWREEIEDLQFREKYKTDKDPEVSYIVISTYASYSKQKVFNILNGFEKYRLLLIADECHNMGSESLIKKLKEIPYYRRIGLSATPERQFDDAGNKKIRKFFNSEGKYTYEYSMEEAINNGVLCRYMYYPHLVRLTSVEMDQYIELSEKISKYFNYNADQFFKTDEILKRLLLARKRIIHKAAGKIDIFRSIIQKRYQEKGNLKYSLIYVPEGSKPDYVVPADDFDIEENIEDDEDADRLINQFTRAVADVDESVTVRKFVSGQSEREAILSDFASGKLQVLTSMKCLDEGVDVPRSELAIFCSSTGNPRQFIQRRGRVLRTHPDKKLAELHDLVVIPEVSVNCDSYRMEQSLLKGELERVKNFALLSENPSYSETELREVMDHYGLNLYNNNY